jgi:hypothetical protein
MHIHTTQGDNDGIPMEGASACVGLSLQGHVHRQGASLQQKPLGRHSDPAPAGYSDISILRSLTRMA